METAMLRIFLPAPRCSVIVLMEFPEALSPPARARHRRSFHLTLR